MVVQFGISQLKSALETSRTTAYHLVHKSQALKVLKNIEPQRGRISASLKKKCDEYSIDVLGSKVYAPWLYVYALISAEFKEGWIPDNFYGRVVVPLQKGGYGKISSHKPLNQLVFKSEAFPDILSYANGVFFDSDYVPIKSRDVVEYLFQKTDRVVYKIDSSLQGKGIYFFNRDSFDLSIISRLGNGLFQRYISQHQSLSAFSASSVATLRMTSTTSESGEVTIQTSYLRLGASSDTHVQSASHIRVPIDPINGSFSNIAYTPDWLAITHYPGKDLPFEGHTYPSFKKAADLVVNLHSKVPYVRCIGWDLAVDESGIPIVMEWNGEHNDIKFSEAVQGPCFVDMGWEKLRS